MLQWLDPDTGARKSRSARTDDPAAAERAKSDLEYELNHRLYQEPSKLDWDKFREMFLAEYASGLRPRTREKFETVLDVFEQIVNPSKLSAVNERTLSLFLKAMQERKHNGGKVGLAPCTMHHYLVNLKREASEKLPWIDWEGNRIVLPAEFVKSDEDQWAALHPVLRQTLAELPRTGPEVFPFRSRKGGGPLSRNRITNFILRMAKRAGVKLSMHKLRKGFGCRAAKQLGKGRAPILHTIMRHSTMQVTMDYYANVDDAVQEAINGLT